MIRKMLLLLPGIAVMKDNNSFEIMQYDCQTNQVIYVKGEESWGKKDGGS